MDNQHWTFSSIPHKQVKENAHVSLEEHLLNSHMMVRKQICKELGEAISNVNQNFHFRYYKGIIQAKEAQLQEHDEQLKVYEKIMNPVDELRKRELGRFCNSLPIYGKRCEVHDWIDVFTSKNRFLIVQGPTGSGKSTQLPQYIAEHPRMARKKIISTQPREISAILLAERVSLEFSIGNTILSLGFHYSVFSSKSKMYDWRTTIEFTTHEKMLERVMNRREDDFSNVGAIIIDDVHERSITCDILLGLLKKNDPLWNDILIVFTLATPDVKAFDFLKGAAKVIAIPEILGWVYPINRVYKDRWKVDATEASDLGDDDGKIMKAIAEKAAEIHIAAGFDSGDILCFLPGADEVHQTSLHFEKTLNLVPGTVGRLAAKIYHLYELQKPEEYKKVFEVLDSKIYRKIIFATDIAETTSTIKGVAYVVDSGLKKETIFDPIRCTSSVKTVDISQWSSLERERRTCRTQPGVCYKLYSHEKYWSLQVNDLPEIYRLPPALVIIYLRKFGVDPVELDWVSPPNLNAMKQVEEELVMLGAIEAVSRRPTDLGELIFHSKQEPKRVRMIYKGMIKGFGMVAIKMAALLSVSNSRSHQQAGNAADSNKPRFQHKDGDVLTMLNLYNQYEELDKTDEEKRLEWVRENSLCEEALIAADSTIRELKNIFSLTEPWNLKPQNSIHNDEDVLELFCSGYFLHAARRVYIEGKSLNQFNYCTIEPQILGSLHCESSLASGGSGNIGLPDWILFDRILNYSGFTVFPLSSRIDVNWIKNENEDFYRKCMEKEADLATEVVEIKERKTILAAFRDKQLKISFEELKCSITVDHSAGSILAYCRKTSVPDVEKFLKNEIGHLREIMYNETLIQSWRANTRLKIGPGYEIRSILFPGDFDTFYLKNLNWSCTHEWLENFIYEKIDRVDNLEKISSLQLTSTDDTSNLTGVVKFFEPSDAAEVFDKLKLELDAIGSEITLEPHVDDADSGIISGIEDVELKITWPLGPSLGMAYISVGRYIEANKLLDFLPGHFPGVETIPIGVSNPFGITCDLPRLTQTDGKLKFVPEFKTAIQPVYKVRAENLPPNLDEIHITEFLNNLGISPTQVTVQRGEIEPPEPTLSFSEIKEFKLAPVRTILGIQKIRVTDYFHDTNALRAGIHAHLLNTVAVNNAYNKLQGEYMDWIEHGLPHRIEAEWRYKFSVHADLYSGLKDRFIKVCKTLKKKLQVSQSGCGFEDEENQPSKFVCTEIRHRDFQKIRWGRRLLEAVVERKSLDARTTPNVLNLLTRTGRRMMEEEFWDPEGYFIQKDYRCGYFYVYGVDSDTRMKIVGKLNEMIEKIENWKQNGIFEKVIMLHKTISMILKSDEDFVNEFCLDRGFLKEEYQLIDETKLLISTRIIEKYQKLVNDLQEIGLIMSNVDKPSLILRNCSVCLDNVDEKFMITSNCDHAFCITCIQNMFTSTARGAGVQEMPVRCPADGCGLILPIQDIVKAVPPIAFPKVTETSLNTRVILNYLQKNNISVQYCPNPGCNQIFKRTDTVGPNFYYCDNCHNDFCLDCTEFLKKPTPAHGDQLCERDKIREEDALRKFANQIRDEILCLHCPRCKTTFFDFDACAALTCYNDACKAAFCAFCLKDCGESSHRHVRKCRFNGSGDLYVDVKKVEEANRLYRIDRLSKFLKNSEDLKNEFISDLNSKLLNALSRDLNDLGIEVQDVLDAKGDFYVGELDSDSSTSDSDSGSTSSDSGSGDSDSDSDTESE